MDNTTPQISRRRALLIGDGSKEAIESTRKLIELLGRNPREHNFEIVSLLGSPDGPKFDNAAVASALHAAAQGLSAHDNLLVLLCLHGKRDPIDLHPILRQHRTKEGTAAFKNFVLILDCSQDFDFTSAPFKGILPGVSLLAMRGCKERRSRNKKYTFFCGLLIEALKGGAANMYGIVSLAGVFTYLQESCMFEKGIHPYMKSLVSESLFLRRTRGLLRRREMQVFCEAFQQHDSQLTAYSYIVTDQEVQGNAELQKLLPKLLELHMIDAFKIHDGGLFKRLFGSGESKGYLLSAYGKHCKDMWDNDYFKYI